LGAGTSLGFVRPTSSMVAPTSAGSSIFSLRLISTARNDPTDDAEGGKAPSRVWIVLFVSVVVIGGSWSLVADRRGLNTNKGIRI